MGIPMTLPGFSAEQATNLVANSKGFKLSLPGLLQQQQQQQ